MSKNYNFEWDPIKARDNQDKHAITFDKAATVFRDSKELSMFDPDHSENAVTIRIISSRKATKQEIKTYGE